VVTATLRTAVPARFVERLAEEVGRRRYEVCFAQSARLELDADAATLRVAVPSRFFADRIGRDFGEPLRRLAAEELGTDARLAIDIEPALFAPAEPDAQPDGDAPAHGSAHHNGHTARPAPDARHRRPAHGTATARAAVEAAIASRRFRHRLEGFVTGPSNELAYAAAIRLAEDEHACDPVFLHGGCGLGKTHLLQGACARLIQRNPGAKVWYTTGEQFTNQYIQAVRANKLDAFRRRVRSLDLLAVDDIHFIADKDKTQQEFLHCFDAIDLAGSRLMLASDCHPKQIRKFSEALVSRCVRGMVVEVRPPDAATRKMMIRQLAERRHMVLREEVIQTLGNRCVGSVREIEGTLTKLHALASLAGNPNAVRDHDGPRASAAIGHALLDRLFAAGDHAPRAPLRFEAILKAVCDRLDVPANQVLGSGRHKHLVLARSIVVHLTRELRKMSYPEIAAAFGKKNHSSVITANKRLTQRLADDERLLLPGESAETPLRGLLDELRGSLARAQA